MRDKILMIGLFFLLMAAIPLCLILQSKGTAPDQSDEISTSADSDLTAQTAALCDDTFSDEAIRAVVILQKSNALAGVKSEQTDLDNSEKELYERVKTIINSEKEILTVDGKAAAVPYSLCSNGFTSESAEYDYLEGVASPWDCFCSGYDAEQDCTGVSVNGLRVLCDKGLSAEEALLWYLPKLQIQLIDG